MAMALPRWPAIPKAGFYDYENKYQPGAAEEITPAPIPAQWEQRLGEAALTVFRALGLANLPLGFYRPAARAARDAFIMRSHSSP